MNRRGPTSDAHDCGGDAAAYVLGALDRQELRPYLLHLRDCAVCRDEVVALSRVVNALAMSAPQYPAPSDLRGRVLTAARDEPWTDSTLPALGALSRPRPLRWQAIALAACVLVLIVVALGGSGVLSNGSPGTRVIQASVVGSPGTASLRVTGSHAELVVNELKPPRPGAVYEVWLTRPGRRPVPANALFGVNATGAANVRLPGDLHGVSQVLVTQEPAGGSSSPTHPAVIAARLT
jgi:hypothetical protein